MRNGETFNCLKVTYKKDKRYSILFITTSETTTVFRTYATDI